MPWPKAVPVNRYPSDLTDEEWPLWEPIFEESEPSTTGRPREKDWRERVHAIFYLNKTGGQWRDVPKDFPAYKWVSSYYPKGVDKHPGEKINPILHRKLRKERGRPENPSAGLIASQTGKGPPESAQESGCEGGKWMKGRKRPRVVDTIGYPLVVVVHAANIVEGKAARHVLTALFSIMNTVKKIWADGAYKGKKFAEWAQEKFDCVIEGVKKKAAPGFQVLPGRWVVERTWAWIHRYRRLSQDDERKPTSSASHVYVASIRLMRRRIFKERAKEAAQEPALLTAIATA